MKLIPMTNGGFVKVDDDDYDMLAQWKWHNHKGYASKNGGSRKNRKFITMHRLLMNAQPGEIVDHVNGDPFDNQRANLRFRTLWQNSWNSRHKIGKSGYRGVKQHGNRWEARIKAFGVSYYLGMFASPEAALEARNEAARGLHGEFAVIYPIPAKETQQVPTESLELASAELGAP